MQLVIFSFFELFSNECRLTIAIGTVANYGEKTLKNVGLNQGGLLVATAFGDSTRGHSKAKPLSKQLTPELCITELYSEIKKPSISGGRINNRK
jgi:hypothetical protein